MGRLQVKIAGNGLEAEVRVAPGPAMALEDLRACLTQAGVVHGVDEQSIERLADRLDDPGTNVTVAIAHGSAAIAGQDGYLRGDLARQLPGTTQPDGSINYRERQALRPAAEGDVLAKIVAPTPGTPGCNVRGEVLEAKAGRPYSPRCGAGVRIEDDALVAAREGVWLATDRGIDVVPMYTHSGDVDYASGNLHSRGSLVIQGDVRDGCVVTANGDIAITGAVQGGGVKAGGSVHVDQGILGSEHAVRAGTDITCHHATSARLVARGTIELGDQVSQALLQAPRIRATEGRGVVRGGELRARDTIEVKSAGSESGTTTTLVVADLLDERAELARRTVTTARLDRAASRQAGRSRKGLRAAVRAGDHERTEQLRVRMRENELLRTARIRITDTCHPGVVLKFGTFELRPSIALGPSSFHFDPDQATIVRGELT